MEYVFRRSTCEACGRDFDLPKRAKSKVYIMCRSCDPDRYDESIDVVTKLDNKDLERLKLLRDAK